ncbi:MAG: maleylpyruvate isomerase family mycothiol-dependent enzyme [Mycobacterium sp.]
MSRTDTYAMVQQEKRDLAALLRTLSPQDWDAPSLCAGWRVRDVLAHLLYDGTSLPKYLYEVVRVGGSADKLNQLYIDRARGWSTDTLLTAFESTIERSYSAKIQPKLVLADLLIHQQDIRRPLNHPRQVPDGTLRTVLDNPDPFIHSKRRLIGLRWTATDMEWTYGDGPEIRGPAEAIVMAVGGRPSALAELSGSGMEVLRSRLGNS